jgi:hypothetical protein
MRFLLAVAAVACLFLSSCSPASSDQETRPLQGNRIPPGAGPNASVRR